MTSVALSVQAFAPLVQENRRQFEKALNGKSARAADRRAADEAIDRATKSSDPKLISIEIDLYNFLVGAYLRLDAAQSN